MRLRAERGATCSHRSAFLRVPTSPSPLSKLSGPVTGNAGPFGSTGPKDFRPQGALTRPSQDVNY